MVDADSPPFDASERVLEISTAALESRVKVVQMALASGCAVEANIRSLSTRNSIKQEFHRHFRSFFGPFYLNYKAL